MGSALIHSSAATGYTPVLQHVGDELIGFHVVCHTIGRIRAAHVRGGGLRSDEVA
jgi:hypothetical protein